MAYDTKNVLKGSSELAMFYTADHLFAQAVYTFPSNPDKNQLSYVLNFVSNKYGKPNYSDVNLSSGKIIYQWEFNDGIELQISRIWPNTKTYLVFTHLRNNEALTTFEKTNKKNQAKQSNLF